MPSLDFEDRRMFARFPVKLPVKYLCPGAKKESQAQAQDISAGGICLETNKRLPYRTILSLWFDIPDDGQLLHTNAEVIWVRVVGYHRYRTGFRLEKPELMGVSRVLQAASVK